MNSPKDIPGFPGYRIYADGRVESCRRDGRASPRLCDTWKPLVCPPNNYGYRCVTLYSEKDRRHRTTVHQLVALLYIGPKPSDLIVCHNDGNRLNNVSSNLRYDTHKANTADCWKHGTGNNTLSLEQAAEIRTRKGADTARKIAEEYGVSKHVVRDILRGRTYNL